MNKLLLSKRVDMEILHQCVSKILNVRVNCVKNWGLEPIVCKSLNFTTEGIYRIHGIADIMGKEVPWSLVVKIIKPGQVEMNDPWYHNYWKREALVNQSDILVNLPHVINTSKCYNVEEKTDGSVWIWMEEIIEDSIKIWTENDYAFVARQLGFFNGAYVTGHTLPEQTWICRNWLESWISGCKRYASDPTVYYPQIQPGLNLENIWNSYTCLNNNMNKHLQTLSKLPRVLAHQDLSRQNMFINIYQGEEKVLTFIDWQFLSISGLGEDLGKLYGVAMSQGNIQSEQGDYYQKLLFKNYIEGLKDAGWIGDITLPRYGFCTSVALRSAWEVPKLIKLAASSEIDLNVIENLTRIVSIQMDLGVEADRLMRDVNLWEQEYIK
ncbi:phosphotransferase [Viridibacillus arvi]|uniref:phosphotransferase n=1 Tax=Viridibacillus arvi TaxID=263475 RepID=UPI003D006313